MTDDGLVGEGVVFVARQLCFEPVGFEHLPAEATNTRIASCSAFLFGTQVRLCVESRNQFNKRAGQWTQIADLDLDTRHNTKAIQKVEHIGVGVSAS
ncbi:MAG: hypothetical protein H6839_14710 [Planctomycetes bacterium]|nr:hypothetical protein [Planctomycetota bacterium]